MATRAIDYKTLTDGQKVAVKYFAAAMVLFVAQIVFGLIAGLQFLKPGFLYNGLNFNTFRMVHINAMIVWILFGFIGSVYWLVEEESGIGLVALRLANFNFWIFN